MFRKIYFLLYILCYLFFITHQRAPLLFKIRSFGFPIFTVLSIISFYYLFSRNLFKTFYFQLIGLILFLLSLVSISMEISYNMAKDHVLKLKDDKARLIGQHLVIGFTDWKEMRELSSKGLIGGIYLTSRNIQGMDKKEIKERIDSIQYTRKLEGLPPLFITADQEGGMVSRLSPPLEDLPTIREFIENTENSKKISKVSEFAILQSKGLKEIGVNVNFSPVVDLFDPNTDHFDLHTQIWRRSLSDSPELTSNYAIQYTKDSNQNKVITTYKHFPGIGNVKADTHFFTASIHKSVDELLKTDSLPYLQLKSLNGFAWIMLSHTKIEALDSQYPSSFSSKVIKQLIREKIGFTGALITDDLSMGPAFYTGVEKVSELSLKSGADFLLISYDKDLFYPIINYLHKREEKEFWEALNQSNQRLEKYYTFIRQK